MSKKPLVAALVCTGIAAEPYRHHHLGRIQLGMIRRLKARNADRMKHPLKIIYSRHHGRNGYETNSHPQKNPLPERNPRPQDCCQNDFPFKVFARDEDVNESCNCQQCRQRIKPHAERTLARGLKLTEDHHPNCLQDELHHDADHDKRGHQICESKHAQQARERSHA